MVLEAKDFPDFVEIEPTVTSYSEKSLKLLMIVTGDSGENNFLFCGTSPPIRTITAQTYGDRLVINATMPPQLHKFSFSQEECEFGDQEFHFSLVPKDKYMSLWDLIVSR